MKKNYNNLNLEQFIEEVKNLFKYLNDKNITFCEELKKHVYSEKDIKNKKDFYDRCNLFFKIRRNYKPASILSKSYWLSIGWNQTESTLKVSKLQKERSVINKEYWINKGLTEKETIIKIKNIQSINSKKRYEKYSKIELKKQSIWSKDFWIERGYSEKDAMEKYKSYNYACREFYKTDDEYNIIKSLISEKTKKFIKNNPEKYKSFFGSISKEELIFFKNIKIEGLNIFHKTFIINIKTDNRLNKGIVKYDGYLKLKEGIILIEYDGLYWHNQVYDDIKDDIALDIRPDIIGIIRISDEYFKNNKKELNNKLYESIKKIESKKSRRIKLY